MAHVHSEGGHIVGRQYERGSGTYVASRVINYIVGAIEFALALRLVFKLLAANAANGFVSFVYSLTDPLVQPFSGIFRVAVVRGAEGTSVFEPSVIVAMVVYAIIGWLIVRLLTAASSRETLVE